MTELWYEIVENPAYRHVLLNHVPITGLAVAAGVLAWAVFEGRWRSIAFGLFLCLLTSASAIPVMQSGDAAYPFLLESLDGPGRAWLDDHAALAERWGRALPANALAAALALALGWRRARWRRALGAGVLATSAFALGAAGVIATAGGQVRHPEFRTDARGTAVASTGNTATMRRLTEAQYRNVIADVFGPGIEIAGRFEPDDRVEGLIALGSARVAVTASGFEQYEAMAVEIARQVLTPERRADWLPCSPTDETRPDPTCSEAILRAVGPRLLRRPLEADEIEVGVALAGRATDAVADYYAGVASMLTRLLVAPDFLFRIESAERAADDGAPRLSAASLASRLSFFLWNTAPDEALLDAATRGDLADPEAYAAEVDRMLASPRLEAGVRALFEDVFQFDAFADLAKDPIRYPVYTAAVAADAREQTLRTVVDHLLARDGDYRALYTTRHSFLTRRLGPIYALPVRAESGWEPVAFTPASGRGGLLTHASFNMLHAHAGRSSPTLRGLFLREALLCQTVPPAPADVDFGLFNADDSPEFRTARDRLAVHATHASCRGCHALTDPVGLGLEPFDGVGRLRTTENGAPIDASGDLDGDDFRDPVGLGEALAAHDRLAACFARQAYRSAIGRVTDRAERAWLRTLAARFADADHRLRPLLREIVHSPGFRGAS